MRQATLVYNPVSGRQISRRLLPSVLEVLRSGGFHVTAVPTKGPGDATRIARDAADEGCEVVFAMGGDGTLREAASGLLGTAAALGPLPAGTTNVLSRAFSLPRNARCAAQVLTSCRPQEVDVGLAAGIPFLMMVSCGLDAEVIAHQRAELKKFLGPGAVIVSALGRIVTYTYPDIELSWNGTTERASFVVVANIPHFGGDFRIAPEADFRDRQLDLVSFSGRGTAATFNFMVDVIRGRHLGRSDVDQSPVDAVQIHGPPDIAVQIDGDAIAVKPPFSVTLSPQRLRVLLPEG